MIEAVAGAANSVGLLLRLFRAPMGAWGSRPQSPTPTRKLAFENPVLPTEQRDASKSTASSAAGGGSQNQTQQGEITTSQRRRSSAGGGVAGLLDQVRASLNLTRGIAGKENETGTGSSFGQDSEDAAGQTREIALPDLRGSTALSCPTHKFQVFSFRLPGTPPPRRRMSVGSITNSGNMHEPFVPQAVEFAEPPRRSLELDKHRNLFDVHATKTPLFIFGAGRIFELHVLVFEKRRWLAMTAPKNFSDESDHFLIESICKLWPVRRQILLIEAVKTKALLACCELADTDRRLVQATPHTLPWPSDLPPCPIVMPAAHHGGRDGRGSRRTSLQGLQGGGGAAAAAPVLDASRQHRRRSSTGLDKGRVQLLQPHVERSLLARGAGK